MINISWQPETLLTTSSSAHLAPSTTVHCLLLDRNDCHYLTIAECTRIISSFCPSAHSNWWAALIPKSCSQNASITSIACKRLDSSVFRRLNLILFLLLLNELVSLRRPDLSRFLRKKILYVSIRAPLKTLRYSSSVQLIFNRLNSYAQILCENAQLYDSFNLWKYRFSKTNSPQPLSLFRFVAVYHEETRTGDPINMVEYHGWHL